MHRHDPPGDRPCRPFDPADRVGPDPSPSPPPTSLEAWGWDAEWAAAFDAASGARSREPARVAAVHGERLTVVTSGGARDARLTGRLRHAAAGNPEALPAVGDWVALEGDGGGAAATVADVLPRRTAFRRAAAGRATAAQVLAANVDLALVVTALPADLSPRRLERYLTLAWESGATPVLLLSKADLADDPARAEVAARAVAPGVDVLLFSAVTGEGVGEVEALLRPERTAVLLGSSGVGKSTLVNRLLDEPRQAIAEVRADGRGRHTTTHRELVRLPSGALLVDGPGMREVALWEAGDGLGAAFADVEAEAAGCRFRDCEHDAEPGCAVREAVEEGRLDAARLEHWRALRRELARLARRHDPAAAADARARDRAFQRSLRAHLRRKGRGGGR